MILPCRRRSLRRLSTCSLNDQEIWGVFIVGSQANDQWEMKITGPNAFEKHLRTSAHDDDVSALRFFRVNAADADAVALSQDTILRGRQVKVEIVLSTKAQELGAAGWAWSTRPRTLDSTVSWLSSFLLLKLLAMPRLSAGSSARHGRLRHGRDGPWRDAHGRGPCLRRRLQDVACFPSSQQRIPVEEYENEAYLSAYGPPAWAVLGRPFRARCSEPLIPGVEQGDCQPRRIAD